MWKLENRVAILESNHNDLAQYGKRNNVIFSGIAENVPEKNLEITVVSILPDTDVQVEPRDIEACHQIGMWTSKRQKTIVRLINRKNYDKVLANKKKSWSWTMKNTTFMLKLLSLSTKTQHPWMRPLPSTVESWNVLVPFMHVTVEMVMSTLKGIKQVDHAKYFI